MADARNDLDSSPTPPAICTPLRRDAPLVQCLTNFVPELRGQCAVTPAPRRRWCTRPRKRLSSRASAARWSSTSASLSQPWLDSMLLTAQAASQASVPWVLDPVAHHATAFRRAGAPAAGAETGHHPRQRVRDHRAGRRRQRAGRGVDAGDPVAQAEQSARELALAQETWWPSPAKWTMSPTDTAPRIAGGDALMPRVTATGCALTSADGRLRRRGRASRQQHGITAGAPRSRFTARGLRAAAVAALSCFAIAGRRAPQCRRRAGLVPRGASWTRWPPCVRRPGRGIAVAPVSLPQHP